MPRFSILILAGEPSVRAKLAADLADGLACAIYTASDVRGALALLRIERPTLLIATHEFAFIHGQPLADLAAAVSPSTRVQFVTPPKAAPALG